MQDTWKRRRTRVAYRGYRRHLGEAGQAMLIVVSMIALVSTVPIVVMATSMGQVSVATENFNWNAAYEAAEAGLNDYIEHLDQNPAYDVWSAGNPNFKCTYGPTTAFGYEDVNAVWTWVNLQDAGLCGWVQVGDLNEWYEYALPSTSAGSMALTVSGRAGTAASAVTRTFTYNVVPTSSFLDNIYWTNYELMDPTLSSGCATDLGIPASEPVSAYVKYATQYMSHGPLPEWGSTNAILSTGSSQVTVSSTTGLSVGDTVSDSAGGLYTGTIISGLGAGTITLSHSPAHNETGDTIYTTLTAMPTTARWTGTGKLTSGSSTITSVSSTNSLSVGSVITDSGGGIAATGVVVTAKTGNTITLSQAATTTAANDNLSAYWSSFSQSPWPPDTNNCWIWFAGADVVNGPTFSNDTIRDGLDGDATFYGQVFSAAAGRNDSFTGAVEPCEYDTNDNPNTIACRAGPATGTPPVFLGDEPEPTTAADAQAAQLVGCYISGGTLASPTPTWVDITMTENGSTTTLKWWANASAPNSPNVDNATANGGNPNGGSGGACGTSGATSAHPSTVTVSSLKSALIYVDGNVTVSTPASNTCGTYTSTDNCEAGFLTIIAGDDTAVGAAEWGSNPSAGDIYLGDSIAYPNTDVSTTAVNCPAGVWAQGGGIANNTCPRSDPADALGLVAQYFIQYPQAPNNCPGTPYTIDAALLTLTDSVYADNWGNGGPCTLNVFGAIGQNFRGPVGTSGPSGYEKDYYYDTSLETLWPPYYLASTSSGWEPFGYAEGKPGTAQRALANVNYAAACGAAC